MNILKYAQVSALEGAVVSVFPSIDEISRQWTATAEQRREIYQAMYQLQKQHTPDSKLTLDMATRFLSSFEGSSDDVAGAKVIASESCILAVRLEDVYQFDELLNLRALQQVRSSRHHLNSY